MLPSGLSGGETMRLPSRPTTATNVCNTSLSDFSFAFDE